MDASVGISMVGLGGLPVTKVFVLQDGCEVGDKLIKLICWDFRLQKLAKELNTEADFFQHVG